MDAENCLQISYRGHIGNIFYSARHRYEKIIQMAMERFSVPLKYKPAVLLSDEFGHIFDRLSFEYYLKLFPEPEMIFYMRFDYNRSLSLFLPEKTPPENSSTEDTTPSKTLKETKKLKRTRDEGNNTYRAVPVRRMNCFIGELPPTLIGHLKEDLNYDRHVTKRMRLIDSKRRSKKPGQPKHILRI